MFGIGAFARLGQVSLRTLRYYDEEGLLRPATVDAGTGYRWYRADQLQRLNRILALRDLGLSLSEIRRVLDDELTPGELRGMLRLRRAETHQRLVAETARLALVEARLRQIEAEDRLDDYDVVVKQLDPVRIAFLSENAVAFSHEILGPLFGRLYDRLHRELARAETAPDGPAIAFYADSGDDASPIKVIAAVPIGLTATVVPGVGVRDVAAVARAATTVHRGPMGRVDEGYQALARWVEEAGERIDGFSRELYLDCDGSPETWVTELQFPLEETTTGPKEVSCGRR